MKYFTTTIAIVLLFACLVSAQTTPRRKFKHGGKIVTTYDKATNRTTVSLQSYTLKNSALAPEDYVDGVDLLAGFTYSGTESVGNPKVIQFALEITRSQRRANRSNIPDLTAEIEGQRINLGKPVLIGSDSEQMKEDIKNFGSVRLNIFTEKFGVLIPVDVFKKLADAKLIKLETGDVKVTLRDKQIEALRDLASRLE